MQRLSYRPLGTPRDSCWAQRRGRKTLTQIGWSDAAGPAPGGNTDIVARVTAEYMAKVKTNVVVETELVLVV